MEEALAAHSSTLAWKIPWTGEPGGSHRVGHDWRDLAAADVDYDEGRRVKNIWCVQFI